MKNYSFDSVIFDMDGVLTNTAVFHSRAWKEVFDEYLKLRAKENKEPFQEFTYEKDYLHYVDGKKREEGIRSFLCSRGIKFSQEIISEIASNKNKRFLDLIRAQGVQASLHTLKFIENLKKAGLKVAIISSSKNCSEIIRLAGIEDLFSVKIDGIESERLKIKSKPEPDIFLAAVKKLQSTPAKSIVVEDAISGIESARNGGFGMVIGIAEKKHQSDLQKNGADLVATDLSKVSLEKIEEHFKKVPKHLSRDWSQQFLNSERKPVFFFDYDGTLTPIVDRPELAVMSKEMRSIFERFTKKYITAVVSGRPRKEVEKMVAVKGIVYAGSHGFDIKSQEKSMIYSQAKEAIPIMSAIFQQAVKTLSNLPGILIENKKFTIAVHYRLVKNQDLSKIKKFIDGVIKDNSSLHLVEGKKVFEIMPTIDWDKGKAVLWIMNVLGISWSKSNVFYLGDDVTDENAFRVVRQRGTAILVGNNDRPSFADYRLSSPEEVKNFLEKILILKK